MYKDNRQSQIECFDFPLGRLNPDNRWVALADEIPWNLVDDIYREKFINNGAPAHPSRMAFGSLVIKQILDCSDEELCAQIAENAYLQYFIGLDSFSLTCPFGASTLVAFRKRFSETDIKKINEATISSDNDDNDGGGEVTLSLDATVAPSDISYPQDVKLLNSAREHLEGIIDDLCAQTGAVKPRMYRNLARKDFLNWSKARKKGAKKTRRAIKAQLNYVRRDLGYLEEMCAELAPDLDERTLGLIETIQAVFIQQLCMYETKTHSVKDRIVSLAQPWVRPIVRGKANASCEFGAKLHISTDTAGFARIDALSFAPYNESERLIMVCEEHKGRTGSYPDRMLVDKIYRTRKNLAYCKEHGIALSGPRLGRPPKDHKVNLEQKKQEQSDAARRNGVEGVFGTTKTAYGLDPVAARLEDTTRTVIALSILVFNLKKLLKVSLSSVQDWLLLLLSRVRVTSRYDYCGYAIRVEMVAE